MYTVDRCVGCGAAMIAAMVSSSPAVAKPLLFDVAAKPARTASETSGAQAGTTIVIPPALTDVGTMPLALGRTGAELAALHAVRSPHAAGSVPASVPTGASELGAPSPAQVAGAAPATQQTDASPTTTEAGDIVVTALKRETTVLKVPAALSVLNGDDLKTAGVNNLADIQNVVPSVTIGTGRDGVTVAVRGVTTNDTSSKGEQDIAFNIDGVYVGRGNARGAAFFDIDRIEVLRGPQGTLYGRSSTGGAINVITNAPRLGEFGGYAKVEYGNYDAKRFEGALNVPIGDKVALRIAGALNDRDGYSRPIDYSPTFNGVTYDYPASSARARNDQKDATGRFSLLFQPSDAATLRLIATIGHQGGAGNAPALETQLQAHDDRGVDALHILANPVPAYQDSNFQNYDAHLNLVFGGAQLDVLGSYQYLNFRQQGTSVQDVAANGGGVISPVFLFPPAPTFGPTFQFYLQRNKVKTYQTEARLSNANSGPIEYVVGANYFDESAGESGQGWNALIDDPYDSSAYIHQAGPVNVTTHEAYGAFGQLTWNVTSRLGIVGGLRYTHEEVDRIGTFALPFDFTAGFPPPSYPDVAGNAICTYPNDCIGNPNNGSSNDSKVTWRAGVNFQATPRNLFYASISTGFKGGGFNDYDPATNGIGQYAPASITAYELGYKGKPLDHLTLSSALYYYDFSKNQITSGVSFPGGDYVIYTQAIPTEIYGWENELSYQIAPQTSLSGSVAYLHSRFVDFQAGQYAYLGSPIDLSGKPLDQAPAFVATAAFNQAFDVGSNSKLRLRAAIKYSDGYYVSDFGDGVRYKQPSFTRSDASVTYEFGGGRYSLQAFVENIENKVQRTILVGYANSGAPYGGAGGYTPAATDANPSPVPVPGDTTIPALPANNLAFYTTTPRFYGLRASMRF